MKTIALKALLFSMKFCNFAESNLWKENCPMKTTDEILELLRQFKSVAGEKYGIEQELWICSLSWVAYCQGLAFQDTL